MSIEFRVERTGRNFAEEMADHLGMGTGAGQVKIESARVAESETVRRVAAARTAARGVPLLRMTVLCHWKQRPVPALRAPRRLVGILRTPK